MKFWAGYLIAGVAGALGGHLIAPGLAGLTAGAVFCTLLWICRWEP